MSARGFSATSINNYIRSPWDYFYRNILRFPEVKPVHMEYGTAVHNTLEYVTKFHTSKQDWPSFGDIKDRLEIELNRLPLNDSEYSQLLEKALDNLVVYIDHLKATKTAKSKEEFSVRVMLPTGLEKIPEIPLTGKIDRLDFDDSGQVIRVVDYKTGKPKTRNEILGLTKNSEPDYHRQLVFYALLLKLHDDKNYVCNNGALSFVEPTPRGVIKEEQFVVTDEEIKSLESDIKEAVEDYVSGNFIKRPCDPEVSKYCDLAKHLIS
jgi:RecB family exonuclease